MNTGEGRSGAEVLSVLKAWPGAWAGQGINHEGEAFDADLLARPLYGSGLLLWFRAKGLDGTVYHEEVGLLGPGIDGRTTLTTANTNVGYLQRFDGDTASGRDLIMAHGDLGSLDGFRETIRLSLNDSGGLMVAFAWAMPGEPVVERSAVTLRQKPNTEMPDSAPIR